MIGAGEKNTSSWEISSVRFDPIHGKDSVGSQSLEFVLAFIDLPDQNIKIVASFLQNGFNILMILLVHVPCEERASHRRDRIQIICQCLFLCGFRRLPPGWKTHSKFCPYIGVHHDIFRSIHTAHWYIDRVLYHCYHIRMKEEQRSGTLASICTQLPEPLK